MKIWIISLTLTIGLLAQAQDQSACPRPRHSMPTSECGSEEGKREITVRVATLDTGTGSLSGGYVTAGSNVGPEAMADAVASVEQRQYRKCDALTEITRRVKDSFQRLGYFCADVDPIAARQTGKNEYALTIHVHPGQKYRLKEITFSGATMFPADELQSIFRMKPNSQFDTGSVRRGVEALQKSYAKKGHPNVTVISAAAVDEKSQTIALDVNIQEDAPAH
jgi:outer membrane translocation and assembly module TamA